MELYTKVLEDNQVQSCVKGPPGVAIFAISAKNRITEFNGNQKLPYFAISNITEIILGSLVRPFFRNDLSVLYSNLWSI